LRIAVCIKQVPDVAELRIDEITHTLIRAGVPSILNPFDEFAVEEALRIRERYGGEITVITMGPPQAKEALAKCYAMGVDRAILLTDQAFAGGDTWATARTLAMTLRKLGFDLIICGMKAIDGETGQVGPEIAELLDIPHISYVKKVEFDPEANTVVAERMTEQGYDLIRCRLPCLLTATKALNVPRTPTLLQELAAKKKEAETWTAADIAADRKDVGLKGSRTQVVKVYTPEIHSQGTIIEADDLDGTVSQILGLLKKEGLVR
jgi:electron transfer flavoprotein alpha/beta subunit